MKLRTCEKDDCERPAKWIVALLDAPFYVCGIHRRTWVERVCYRLREA